MNELQPPEFQGYFWIPNAEDRRVPGRCYCSESGAIEIEILGTFSGQLIENNTEEVPRILGVSNKGKLVTLENCFYAKRDFNLPGIAVSKLHVNLMMVGCHFDDDENVEFDAIAIHSEALDEWLHYHEIEVRWKESPRRVDISYAPPKQPVWKLKNGERLTLKSAWRSPSVSQVREAKITQKTWVEFQLESHAGLEQLLSYAHRFNDLVSFATDQTLPIEAIQVFSSKLTEKIGEKTRKVPIDVFYNPNSTGKYKITELSSPYTFLPFSRVKEQFGDFVSQWLENYEKFDSSFNLYFATKAGRDLYMENRFLMLAQAVEALHRHMSTETLFKEEEYSKFCAIIRKCVPEEFMAWVEARLKYGNELALRHRLKSMFNGFEALFRGNKKVKALISKIVIKRNYLTHYDKSLKDNSSLGRELYKLCLVLEVLFQLHMAKMIGLSNVEILELCDQSESFKRKKNAI